jgi:hypothetical protein
VEFEIALGVGPECGKKDLIDLSADEIVAFNNGLTNRLSQEFTGFKLSVKADFIEVMYGKDSKRSVPLAGVSPYHIEKLVANEINHIIDNPEYQLKITSVSKSAMDKMVDDLVAGGSISDARTEEDMMNNLSPGMKKFWQNMQKIEDAKSKK